MSTEQAIEEKLYEYWQEKGYFKANPSSSKKPYSLLMPPPNLTGELHLGHAMEHSIMDAIARFKRLQGYDVLLLPGVDHAGIQFEGTLNKILSKEGLTKQKIGREAWLKRAWVFKDEVYKSFHKTWGIMGISADWSREVFALEPKVAKAVFSEFKTFWDQELLYKGTYIVQWCPKCQTAIEDIEMEYQEKKEKLFYVKYQIQNNDVIPAKAKSDLAKAGIHGSLVKPGMTGNYITVATARPETIFADVAIAVYPKHPKFAKYVGKKVKNPFTNKLIPVIEDGRVKKDFGTGALKITPGHDLLDYEIGKDHSFEILHAIGKDGRLTNLTGELEGMKVVEGREKSVEKLKELGLLEKEEDYTHSVPVCERCKTVVEPLISEEWFVKMKPLAEKALKNLKKINFIPKNYHKIISDWLKNIHDWSISRSLWWGHRIPVWHCGDCNPGHKVGKDQDMIISMEKPKEQCKTCKGNNWIQEEQVLDTWFSSGLWPMATLGWSHFAEASRGKSDETEELKKYYPWDFETSAPEIKYLWIARMIILSLWFTNEVPFKNMFFHGMLRDLQGRKFSKSLGNGIDPLELINKWGVDSTRMALYTYSAPGRDGRASRQTIDERCKNFRNFGTKLKNIARFIIDLSPDYSSSEEAERLNREVQTNSSRLRSNNKEDKTIIKQFYKTIKEATKDLETFQLHLAVDKLYDFIWHEFADKYIEQSKKRRNESQPLLEKILKESLIILHPFMPFTTEELYQKFPDHKESIMLENWPSVD